MVEESILTGFWVAGITRTLEGHDPITVYWTKSLRDSLELTERVMLRGMR